MEKPTRKLAKVLDATAAMNMAVLALGLQRARMRHMQD
jgi:hypothetical protein